MDIATHQSGDFISYPTHRVVGTLPDATQAREVVEALLAAGFEASDIDILHGEHALHRLDPTGAEHGWLAQVQRTLIRIAGPTEEFAHLRHYVDDVRAGHVVVMILASARRTRELAADVLNRHGAEFVGFYGRWTYEGLGPDAGGGQQVVLTTTAGEVSDVRVNSDASATIVDGSAGDGEVRGTVLRVRPDVLMVAWQRRNGSTVVRLLDVDHGTFVGLVSSQDGIATEKGTAALPTPERGLR